MTVGLRNYFLLERGITIERSCSEVYGSILSAIVKVWGQL